MPFLISTNCSFKQVRAVGLVFPFQLVSGQHHLRGLDSFAPRCRVMVDEVGLASRVGERAPCGSLGHS